jgi:MIP family channel proteins
MYHTGQKMFAEFVGTFSLIFFGVSAICANGQAGGGSGLVGVALAHGLAIAVMVAAVGHISGGHFNPAVTAAFWVTRKQGTLEALLYWVAQLAGAAAAAYVVSFTFSPEVWRHANLGTPSLAADVTPTFGMLLEAVMTFLLVFVIFGTAADKNSAFGKLAPFAIGLTISADILAGGVLTGAAMNPARSFGPALVGRYWLNHSVYWVGPLIGGIAAGWIYQTILMRKSDS